jgi:hypothetical protein
VGYPTVKLGYPGIEGPLAAADRGFIPGNIAPISQHEYQLQALPRDSAREIVLAITVTVTTAP